MKVNNIIFFCSEWSSWNGFVLHLFHYDGFIFDIYFDNSLFSINFTKNFLYIDLFFMTFKIYSSLK